MNEANKLFKMKYSSNCGTDNGWKTGLSWTWVQISERCHTNDQLHSISPYTWAILITTLVKTRLQRVSHKELQTSRKKNQNFIEQVLNIVATTRSVGKRKKKILFSPANLRRVSLSVATWLRDFSYLFFSCDRLMHYKIITEKLRASQ